MSKDVENYELFSCDFGYQVRKTDDERIVGPLFEWHGDPPGQECEILISNLPTDCYENELLPVLLAVGRVYQIQFKMDNSGHNQGYGFARFGSEDEAKAAVQNLNGVEIRDHHIIVTPTVDNNQSSNLELAIDNMLLGEENSIMFVDDPSNYDNLTVLPNEREGEVSYILIIQDPENITEIDNTTIESDKILDTEPADVEEKKDEESKTECLNKPHICAICSFATSKKGLLTRHMRTHSDERPYKCTMCSMAFKWSASLKNHLNAHTGTKPYKCKYCPGSFTTSGELVRHRRYKHTKEKPYKCTRCPYRAVERSKLLRHIRFHTAQPLQHCPECPFVTADVYRLKMHILSHSGGKPFVCNYCQARFTQSTSLKMHKLKHNIEERPIFHCELCPTTCKRMSDLRFHVQRIHLSEKELKCQICEKIFYDKYEYRTHRKICNIGKPFKCEICSYKSSTSQRLQEHILIHTDEKPIQCEKCSQRFRQIRLLKRHDNLYHNPKFVPPPPNEKKHKCTLCGKSFRYKGYLSRHHLAVHNPESGVKEMNLALKLGRRRKLQPIVPQLICKQSDDNQNCNKIDEINNSN